ncbi:hypothetical protein PMIN04_006168 [Paraphaeosphaeria minitans]
MSKSEQALHVQHVETGFTNILEVMAKPVHTEHFEFRLIASHNDDDDEELDAFLWVLAHKREAMALEINETPVETWRLILSQKKR